jgi:hypothetical protein
MHALRVFVILLIVGLTSAPACTRSCTRNSDCGSDEGCFYKIGSCSAMGECQDIPKPGCFNVVTLCGCNGSIVTSSCGYPEGYASGPTTGADCSTPEPDAGPQGGFNSDE